MLVQQPIYFYKNVIPFRLVCIQLDRLLKRCASWEEYTAVGGSALNFGVDIVACGCSQDWGKAMYVGICLYCI